MKKPRPLALSIFLFLFALLAVQASAKVDNASDWPVYGGDDGGQRHSQLSQITPNNVAGLETAWIFKSGVMAAGFSNESALSFQTTPIFWNGKLFLSSATGNVFAVDAATGEEIWRFDPAIPPDMDYAEFASRGVSIWHAPESSEAKCSHRIFSGTLTGGLFALDADTGKPCEEFANNGFLDLRTLAGLTSFKTEDYTHGDRAECLTELFDITPIAEPIIPLPAMEPLIRGCSKYSSRYSEMLIV